MKQSLVWYASYGSNLLKSRFMCYIEGGKPEGSDKVETGCEDKTPPSEDKQIFIPHQMYFAKNSPRWQNGGIAFIDVEKGIKRTTLGRMYLITESQFRDVVKQENDCVAFSIDLEKVKEKGSFVFHNSWYGRIIYLGEDGGYPVFSFTAPWSMGEVETTKPLPSYLKIIIRGLKEAYLDKKDSELLDYLASKPGITENYRKEQLRTLV